MFIYTIKKKNLNLNNEHLSEQMMSEKEDGDEDRELLVKTRPKTKRPPLYKVLLINDDYTPMEFVVMILEKFFGLTNAQAVSYTHLRAHET